jgi:thymidylate synthase (FAD)
MTDITFRSDMGVHLMRSMASDHFVVEAAKVSTLGEDAVEASGGYGFIDYLLRNRHGSPFEHSMFTFLITAPIFVWREFMRHRIASYNEESGRYTQLKPVFYIPNDDRNLVQVGKPGHYTFQPGTTYQLDTMQQGHMRASQDAYQNYLDQLEAGIAKEVARMTLPLNIYSSAFVTMNARSLMNFLSLRVKASKEEGALFESFPQREIEMVAQKMEEHFKEQMPLTHQSFITNGRVAP